jgi:putative transposase
VLGLSTSGYYAWLTRPASQRSIADTHLTEKIRRFHGASDGTYGAPRILRDLRDDGVRVGCKRVARLMRRAGLAGVGLTPFCVTTTRDGERRGAPDLVERQFCATRRDQLWVADITYIPTSAGFLFLAIVLDVWSRRIVGWAMANHLRTELVLDALDMAIMQRKPKNVIHHSDQGCQYTSIAFGARCEQEGIRPSTGSVGDAYDNAMAESFFATLERELLNRRKFATTSEAQMAVFRYIEGWYNPHRRHSALDYQSPMNYERSCQAT